MKAPDGTRFRTGIDVIRIVAPLLEFLAGLLLIAAGTVLLAGGPAQVDAGNASRWDGTVDFTIDQGPLGSLSNADAATLVRSAFQKWEAVSTASLQFNDLGFLPTDVTSANVSSFIGDPPQVHSENPIIFDSDDSIIDLYLGAGSSNTILGFAGPRFLDPTSRTIVSAWAVLNGKMASNSYFLPTMIHEFGHLLGLDHTQINEELLQNADSTDNHFVPIMYPILVPNGPQAPLHDDGVWLSWLNPASTFKQRNILSVIS